MDKSSPEPHQVVETSVEPDSQLETVDENNGSDKDDQSQLKAKIGAIIAERVRENQDLLAVQEKIREVTSMLQKLEREKITRETRLHELATAEQELRRILAGPVAAAKQQQREQLTKRTLGDAMSHIKSLGQQSVPLPPNRASGGFNSLSSPSVGPSHGSLAQARHSLTTPSPSHSAPTQAGPGAGFQQPPPPPPAPRLRGLINANPQSAPAQLVRLPQHQHQQRGPLSDYHTLMQSNMAAQLAGGALDAALLAGIRETGAANQLSQQSLAYLLHTQAQAQAQAAQAQAQAQVDLARSTLQGVTSMQTAYDSLLSQTRALNLEGALGSAQLLQPLSLYQGGFPGGQEPKGDPQDAFKSFGYLG